MKTGIELITDERVRQCAKELFFDEHDDEHVSGELNDAAICYASAAAKQARGEEMRYIKGALSDYSNFPFPWEDEWWKPSEDQIRNLVKAGALIAAEIDRLQRKNLVNKLEA